MSDGGGDEVRVHPVGVFEQRVAAQDTELRLPMLLLRDEAGREVHIPIGSCDGFAIHIALTQQPVARPLTHDLGLHLLEKLSAHLEHVVIDAFTEQGCRATLSIGASDGTHTLQARAGDGIALALRAELPIYMTQEVLEQASSTPGPEEGQESL